MIEAKEAVVWVNRDDKEVRVAVLGGPETWLTGPWCDPIGAAYTQWRKMTDSQRAQLMTETAVELAMQGYDLGMVLREFAEVDCFRALGSESIPMCRALTTALVGRCLEPNTMSFEELLVAYALEKDEACSDGPAWSKKTETYFRVPSWSSERPVQHQPHD